MAARGLEAVLDYSRRIDGAALEAGAGAGLAARSLARPIGRPIRPISQTIARVRDNILAFQEAILHRDVILDRGDRDRAGLAAIVRCAGWASASRAGRRPIPRAC